MASPLLLPHSTLEAARAPEEVGTGCPRLACSASMSNWRSRIPDPRAYPEGAGVAGPGPSLAPAQAELRVDGAQVGRPGRGYCPPGSYRSSASGSSRAATNGLPWNGHGNGTHDGTLRLPHDKTVTLSPQTGRLAHGGLVPIDPLDLPPDLPPSPVLMSLLTFSFRCLAPWPRLCD